jgi:hypothetical protein
METVPPPSRSKRKGATKRAEATQSPRYVMPALLTPQGAFEHFRARAAAEKPVLCTADVPVVVHNVTVAFGLIGARLQDVARALPALDLPFVLEMPNLAQALLFASGRVAKKTSSKNIAAAFKDANTIREPMLRIAEGLALLDLLPSERVAKIRAGSGPYDAGRDLIDLVGLYREFAQGLANKQPFDEAWFARAEKQGAWLLANVTPTGAVKPARVTPSEAATVRDQLWAMLLQRDVKLRVIASVLYEDAAEATIPALQARAALRDAGGEDATGDDTTDDTTDDTADDA